MFTSNVHNTKKDRTHGPWTHDAGVPTPAICTLRRPIVRLAHLTREPISCVHPITQSRYLDVSTLPCASCSSTIITVCVHYPKLINQVVTFPWTPALLTPLAIDLSPNWKVFTLLFVCSLYLATWSAVLSELVPSCTKAGEDVDLWHSLPVSVHELRPLADWSRLRFSALMSVDVKIFLKKRVDSWIKRDQLDVTCFIISLFNAQHVSDVNTSILRGLRLICWVISWVLLLWYDVCWCYVVVWLGWCGIRMQVSACHTTSAKPQRNTNTHRTRAIQPMK